MKTIVSPRDLELLSAYLDGQLNPRQRAKLSARLDKEPELNQMLEDLHRTKMLLSNSPKLRAPRSFKLTPEMVEAPQRKPIFPIFQFATLAAAVLLIVVLVGDLFGAGGMAGAPSPIALEAPQEELLTEETQLEAFSEESATESPETMQAEEPASVPYPAPAERAVEGGEEISPTISAEAEARIASDTLETAPEEPDMGLLAVPEGSAPAEEPPYGEVERAPINWLRVLEAALAVMVVGFGATAVILRRRARL